MRTVIFAVAVVAALSTAAMPGSDGPFTTEHWTNGLYAQQTSGPVALYPNPASNEVNIIYPGLTGEATVTLFTEDGRIVHQVDIGEVNSVRTIFDVANLGNGMYFIQVVQPSGLNVTRRLMVAN